MVVLTWSLGHPDACAVALAAQPANTGRYTILAPNMMRLLLADPGVIVQSKTG